MGGKATGFTLASLEGEKHSLEEMLRSGPVLLAFFKISCPTCQLTFPYLSRISGGGIRFVGISQDDAALSKTFAQRFGVSFTVLLDESGKGYPVSNAYKITHVPTMFLVEPDGTISDTWTGFARAGMERLAVRARLPVFTAADQVPAWKPG